MDSESPKQKEPIRGWLVLVGIGVWISPFANALLLIDYLFGSLPFRSHMAFYLIQNAISLALSTVTLVKFVKRKAAFVHWYITTVIVAFIFGPVFSIVFYDKIFSSVVYGIIDIIWILYVIRSQRVKRTFIH